MDIEQPLADEAVHQVGAERGGRSLILDFLELRGNGSLFLIGFFRAEPRHFFRAGCGEDLVFQEKIRFLQGQQRGEELGGIRRNHKPSPVALTQFFDNIPEVTG